jgi:hypothetical protein
MKPMTPGRSADPDPQQLSLDRFLAQDDGHPAHRANKLVLAVAPAHPLPYWEAPKGLLQHGYQECAGRLTGLSLPRDEPSPFGRLLAIELADVQSARAGEASRRLGRLAFGVEGACDRGTLPHYRLIGLLEPELPYQQRQPAWCGEGFQVLKGQPIGLQLSSEARGEGLRQGSE